MQVMYSRRPNAGNGPLITMCIPVRPDGDAADVVNTLNLADAAAPWATHSVGGWSHKDDTLTHPAGRARRNCLPNNAGGCFSRL